VSSLYRFIKLRSSLKKLKRFKDIASILARHGVADVTARTGVGRVFRVARKIVSLGQWKDKEVIPTGARLRSICEELGATFIKFGQVLANRPDLLPPDVIVELSKLQDDVPPFSFDQVKEILRGELHRPVEELFAHIDEDVLAAASIAQVHRAELATGEKVVIKVKRPGLEQTVNEDLAVLRDIAAYIEDNFEGLEHIRPRAIVEEFARTFAQEMDFKCEVRNMERFAANFEEEPLLRVPRVYRELSTTQFIVMEYLEGTKVTHVESWEDFPLNAEEIADLGTRLLLRSVFEHRFYHADPHPGNFMIAPDGRVCLLDFGMMGYISESRMEELLSFMVALVSYDSRMLVETVLEAGLAPGTIDVKAFQRDAELMLHQFASLSLEEIELQALLRMALDVIYRHRISLPTDLLMVARALGTIEGIARSIYPEFSPLKAVQPYFISLFLRRALDPAHQAEQAVDAVMELVGLARQLPRDLAEVTRQLKQGELTVRLDNQQAAAATRARARGANRLAGSLLAAAGVGASLFLANLDSVPTSAAVVSMSLSFVMALWVVWGIRRAGGM